MEEKQFIGIEEGEAVAAFVSRIEEKTGKTLRAVHVRHAKLEPVRYAVHDLGMENKECFESSLNVSLEFFQTPYCPPNQTQ